MLVVYPIDTVPNLLWREKKKKLRARPPCGSLTLSFFLFFGCDWFSHWPRGRALHHAHTTHAAHATHAWSSWSVVLLRSVSDHALGGDHEASDGSGVL